MSDGNASGAHAPGSPRTLEALQPRVSWDRVHNRLLALPGSQHTALVNGGIIPDVGQYAAYTGNGLRIGELDEEFIYERRVGDAFLLGTNAWRLERIEADRVIVSPAEGAPATVPFWRGEGGGRTYDLGLAIGAFLRELKDRLDAADLLDWLQRECHLDVTAARNLRQHVTRQLVATGSLPTDRTLASRGVARPARRLAGGPAQSARVAAAPGAAAGPGGAAAAAARLPAAVPAPRRRRADALHRHGRAVLDLFDGLTPENVEGLVLDELADSPLFALRFRQNAARALLMPRGQAGQRAPLWLQRLRGRDLLQVCRRHADFPVVAETFRECLHDHLDVPRLQQLLSDIRDGSVDGGDAAGRDAVAVRVGPAVLVQRPLTMYQYDARRPRAPAPRALDQQLLEQLVAPERQAHLLDPRAIHQVERRLRGLGQPPRSATEAAEWLRRLGDLSPADLEGPMAAFLQELEADGRARRIELPRCREPVRWVAAEEEALYRQAFGLDAAEPEQARAAGTVILGRFLTTHALVGLARRAGPLSVRAGMGAAAAGGVVADGPGDGGAGRRRRAAAVVGAGEPGAGAARQPGPAAPRGGRLSAAAVRRLPAALAGRPSRRRARAGRKDWPRRWIACRGCRCPRSCGSRRCCRPACRLSAALAGRMDRGRRRRLGRPGEGRGGLLAFLGRETLSQLPPPAGPDLPSLGDDALRVLEHLGSAEHRS